VGHLSHFGDLKLSWKWYFGESGKFSIFIKSLTDSLGIPTNSAISTWVCHAKSPAGERGAIPAGLGGKVQLTVHGTKDLNKSGCTDILVTPFGR
jgi:hypothetical protein